MQVLVVQNIDIEGPGLLRPAMEKAGWQFDIRLMDHPGANLPCFLDGYHALIVLGGPMNVYEEELYPYLRQVEKLIREAIQKGLPVLGICLGGQLIAKALGASVTSNPVQEIGWYRLNLTAASRQAPLFTGLPEEFHVFQWHGDTFDLPAGAVHLAETAQCRNQAFLYNLNVYALQFHPEVTPEIIDTWAEAYASELAEFFNEPGAADRLKAQTAAIRDEYEQVASRFLTNWIGVLAGSPSL